METHTAHAKCLEVAQKLLMIVNGTGVFLTIVWANDTPPSCVLLFTTCVKEHGTCVHMPYFFLYGPVFIWSILNGEYIINIPPFRVEYR